MQYLVISHGPMAKGAVESAEMILGSQPHVHHLSVTVDSTIDSMYEEIKELLTRDKEEWVILTDIIGGTPFNAAYRYLSEYSNAIIATGFNLPLLIELCMQEQLTLQEAVAFIEEAQPNTMSIVDKVTVVEDENVFELDL